MSVAVRADFDYADAVRPGARLRSRPGMASIARVLRQQPGRAHVGLIKLYGSMELAP